MTILTISKDFSINEIIIYTVCKVLRKKTLMVISWGWIYGVIVATFIAPRLHLKTVHFAAL